jgi:hypothetical protein
MKNKNLSALQIKKNHSSKLRILSELSVRINVIQDQNSRFARSHLRGSLCCSNNSKETDRSRIMRLLTTNGSKDWKIEQWKIDNKKQVLNHCDSAKILNMKADHTWQQIYEVFSCNDWYEGSWTLNEMNDIIQIKYYNHFRYDSVQSDREIILLSDSIFWYGYFINNRYKEVILSYRLK